MANIYDKASLVMIPSGTKTSKIFSQKPVNGDGDFTFSRSTAATRVNADGNIEKETQNLLLQSNTFSDATWFKNTTSVTSGQTGYDGSSNAWLLNSTGTGFPRIEQIKSASGVFTLSVYAKPATDGFMLIRTFGADAQVWFDLSDGSISNASGGQYISSTIEDVGNGWYRYSVIANGSLTSLRIYPASAYGVYSTSGNGIYIQDAQLEQGLVARDYIETTTAAVEGGITDNVPRLDYTDSSCPALLLEPQRRNVLPHSEYFGVYNALNGASIESNYSESPEGYNNATRVQLNAQSLSRIEYAAVVGSAVENKRFSVSCWVKSNGADTDFRLKCTHAGVLDYHSNDLVATSEWKRFTFTQLFGAGGGSTITAGVLNGTSNNSADLSIYGLQLEDDAAGGGSSYATSYIPTYGTSVTRNGDKTFAENLGLTDSYTMFIEYNSIEEAETNFQDYISLQTNDVVTNGLRAEGVGADWRIYPAGLTHTMTFPLIGKISRLKKVLVVTPTSIKLFEDGALRASTTGTIDSHTIDVVATTRSGTQPASVQIASSWKQLLIFPTALSNEEAIALTTI